MTRPIGTGKARSRTAPSRSADEHPSVRNVHFALEAFRSVLEERMQSGRRNGARRRLGSSVRQREAEPGSEILARLPVEPSSEPAALLAIAGPAIDPAPPAEILYVYEDAAVMAGRLAAALGRGVSAATSPEAARPTIEAAGAALKLVITGMRFGAEDPEGGLRLLDFARRRGERALPVIVVNPGASQGNVVQCLERGAFTYLDGELVGERWEDLIRKSRLALIEAELSTEFRQSVDRKTSALEAAQAFMKSQEPSTPWANDKWSLHHHAEPCEEVGGDFAMIREVQDAVVFAVGDVKGHGVEAALLAGMLRASIEAALHSGLAPEVSIRQVLEGLEIFKGSDLATLVCCILEPDGRVRYLNAGHPPMLILSGMEVRALEATSRLLMDIPGVDFDPLFSSERMERGDYLLAFSDLVLEATNNDDEEFGRSRARLAFQACRRLPARDILPDIRSRLVAFSQQAAFKDDLTLLLVERL